MKSLVFGKAAALGFACLVALTGCPAQNQPPTPAAVFDADTRIGEGPLTVQFTDMSVAQRTTPTPTLSSWAWNFGDGATSSEQNPSHTYANPGLYSVTLTVKNNLGNSGTRTHTNMINVLDPNREQGTFAGEQRTFAGVPFVWIPAGTYTQGDGDPDFPEPDALPQRQVTISRGFWMSVYEVTQAQWQNVMGTKPGFFDAYDDSYPIESVSWYMAQQFVNAMNAMGQGLYRLPSEAEWEHACRAGTTTDFYFGDDGSMYDNYGWSFNTTPLTPQPVGMLLPNAWGLYDMHGNINEWTQDFYASVYPSADPVTDPFGAPGGPFNVVRGGAYRDAVYDSNSATRSPYLSAALYDFIGFRLVRQ